MANGKSKAPYGHLAILRLSQIVAFDCTLGDAAKRVFMVLAGYSSHDNYSCFPSASKIAKSMGKSRQAITKQIDILAQHQYLTKKRRSCPKTRKNLTSLLTFNILLAKEYHDEPDIFCKHNVTLVVTYLATLLRYGVLQPGIVASPVIPKDCKKKTSEINNIKKPWKDIASQKARIRASAWQQKKEREEKTGVKNEHANRLENLNDELRQYMSQNEFVNFSLSAQKETRGLGLLEGTCKLIEIYEEKLKEARRGAC